ncbi:MAG: rod shape-determining protein MreC [Clostridiaceae bacterium]|nr:rod shape-determining protein MreC [Clostridiaceae bacterium]
MKFFRSKLFYFTLAVSILCISLMLYSAATGQPSVLAEGLGAVITPVQGVVSDVVGGVQDFFGYFYRYAALKEENERLKEKLDDYQDLEQRYLSAINENTQLRKLTGLVQKYSDFNFELCQVASVYRGVAQVGMVLSKGSGSGIEQGDAVMTQGGLIGYVSSVGANYCEVVTVLDISFKAEAKVCRTKETVIVEGDFELLRDGRFKLAYLPNDADLKKDDLIETSGYGGIYPQGLILGRVDEIKLDSGGLTSYAVMKPVDDILDLNWVYVVKDFEVVE